MPFALTAGRQEVTQILVLNNIEDLMALWDWLLEVLHDTRINARISSLQVIMQAFDFFGNLLMNTSLIR